MNKTIVKSVFEEKDFEDVPIRVRLLILEFGVLEYDKKITNTDPIVVGYGYPKNKLVGFGYFKNDSTRQMFVLRKTTFFHFDFVRDQNPLTISRYLMNFNPDVCIPRKITFCGCAVFNEGMLNHYNKLIRIGVGGRDGIGMRYHIVDLIKQTKSIKRLSVISPKYDIFYNNRGEEDVTNNDVNGFLTHFKIVISVIEPARFPSPNFKHILHGLKFLTIIEIFYRAPNVGFKLELINDMPKLKSIRLNFDAGITGIIGKQNQSRTYDKTVPTFLGKLKDLREIILKGSSNKDIDGNYPINLEGDLSGLFKLPKLMNIVFEGNNKLEGYLSFIKASPKMHKINIHGRLNNFKGNLDGFKDALLLKSLIIKGNNNIIKGNLDWITSSPIFKHIDLEGWKNEFTVDAAKIDEQNFEFAKIKGKLNIVGKSINVNHQIVNEFTYNV